MRLVETEEMLHKRFKLTRRQYERDQAWMAKMRQDIEDDVVRNFELTAALAASKAEGKVLLAKLYHRMERFSAWEMDLAIREAGICH